MKKVPIDNVSNFNLTASRINHIEEIMLRKEINYIKTLIYFVDIELKTVIVFVVIDM